MLIKIWRNDHIYKNMPNIFSKMTHTEKLSKYRRIPFLLLYLEKDRLFRGKNMLSKSGSHLFL